MSRIARLTSFDAKGPFGKDRSFTWLISEFVAVAGLESTAVRA